MRKKMILAALAALALSAMPAWAETKNVPVEATIEPSYTVSLPASISLQQSGSTHTFTGEYSINCTGNMDGRHYVEIKTEGFEASDGKNKVKITNNYWNRGYVSPSAASSHPEYTALGTATKGKLTTTINKAGAYEGVMTVTFTLKTFN